MARHFAGSTGNRLLASLPSKERERFLEVCTEVPMDFGHTIQEACSPIRHLHFPLKGYVSLITPRDGADKLEVGLVGREGVVGATVLLGVAASPSEGLVQGAGSGLRMSASSLRSALKQCPRFDTALRAYLFVMITQIAQAAACGRFHRIEARLARWILMTHDRAGKAEFPLTHQFLAHMLGVRRAGVSEAAGALQARKLIYYRRGAMQVLNRRALEAIACPCYEFSNRVYEQHLGSLPFRSP